MTRIRRRRADAIDERVWRFLTDAPRQSERFARYLLRHPTGRVRELWLLHRDAVLDAWTHAQPGTRPSLWWRWDAPPITSESRTRYSIPLHVDLPEPRRRVSGRGTVRTFPPSRWSFGMPLDFLRREDIADAQGIDIWTDAVPDGPRSDGTVEGVAAARSAWERSRASLRFRACTTADGRELVAFDPAHAPVFEDEAAYLDRHGLLTAHERRALGLSG